VWSFRKPASPPAPGAGAALGATPATSPVQQLEQVKEQRRAAKAVFDSDFHQLRRYYETHPPERRPFLLDDKYYYQPVNALASVPAEQRRLESDVVQSRQRWAALQKQEADLEFALGLKR
jgi:hypothetical protein